MRCAKNLITEGCTDNCSVVLVDSVGDPNYRINGEMGWAGEGGLSLVIPTSQK